MTNQIDEAPETCPKCEARMVPMMAIETVPSWSMKLDEEDPDYSSDDPYFDADGEVSIGFRVCRNCQTMLTFWIESATAKFMPDWGHKRPDQEALERQRVPEVDDAWAERFCAAVNWMPDGTEGKIVEGQLHTVTFRDLAKGYIRAVLAAAPEPDDGLS